MRIKSNLLALIALLFISTTLGAQNTVQITIIYAPESEAYMPEIIKTFNESACDKGENPLTGEKLSIGVCVTGEAQSSGLYADKIASAIQNPSNSDLPHPVIFQPSVTHWLTIVNYKTGQNVFPSSNIKLTTRVPVVIAIWESRLKAIETSLGKTELGWTELLNILGKDWKDFGLTTETRSISYGHTDPSISSTGLSTLIAEYSFVAKKQGYPGYSQFTLDQVNSQVIQSGVRDIESHISHYAPRTTEFKWDIAAGPDYVDFVALEENDIIDINRYGVTNAQGIAGTKPPERMVAIYPKEGMFLHEHPLGILNALWVTGEQQDGARLFAEYVVKPDQQKLIMKAGLRPYYVENNSLDPDVFNSANGVDPNMGGILGVIEPIKEDVLQAILESWNLVQKQADITLMIDVSTSMLVENKLPFAQTAAQNFISHLPLESRVGLTVFSTQVVDLVPLDILGNNRPQLETNIANLQALGRTVLFDAIAETLNTMNQQPDDRIRAIILLSDGRDEVSSNVDLQTVEQLIRQAQEKGIHIYPIAYGSEADLDALRIIAEASRTHLYNSTEANSISEILEQLSGYF